MEIDEVAARVLHRYWRVLVAALLLPVALVAFYYIGRPPVYTSAARLVATDTVPKSTAEADAVVSEARAFATSRNVLADAIADAHVSRDADTVLPQVSVSGLGSSPLVELSVSDADADAAQLLAQALATRVVQQLATSRSGGADNVLRNIDAQLTQLASRRAALAAAAAAAPHDPVAQNRLAGLDRLISDLSAARNKVSLDAAAVGQPRVVQPAERPAGADSPGLVSRISLAALLGLVIGIGISAWAEIIRPTVPGASRVARMLDTPLLGTMVGGPAAVADVGRRVRLAAARRGLRTVVLVGTGRRPLPPAVVAAIAAATLPDTYGPGTRAAGHPPIEVPAGNHAKENGAKENGVVPVHTFVGGGGRPLSVDPETRLAATAAPVGVDGAPAVLPSGRSTSAALPGSRIGLRRVCVLEDLGPGAEASTETGAVGVVVVAGSISRLSAVRAVRDLLTAADWPLLGVVAERKRGGGARS
jgi:capsular polysaccharide biosynthesis protein